MRVCERRDLLVLFAVSLMVRLVVAAFIGRAGYMDPAYYAAGAVNLAEGGGLDEPFIWNYLGDPAGVPHPGFLYWMPLPSLLAAPFAALFPGSFLALQLPFALLSALFSLVGYVVAWEVTGVRRRAWLAGLLVLFSGFFFPHWTLPETFAPFALFGGLALWLAGRSSPLGGWLVSLLVGSLVGLAHLTRADGILLLPVVLLASLVLRSRITHHVLRFAVGHIFLVMLGYVLVMAPWFLRNVAVVGAPLSSAGVRTLWLTSYDDLYCYGCDLSPQSYIHWGWGNIWRSKLLGVSVNFQRFLGEDCLIFLLPLVPIGFYRLRRHPSFTFSLIYLLLVYLLHSLAFTYPGFQGGFFHASAPALPFLYTAAAEGLDATVDWVGRRRRWSLRQARMIFAVAVIVGAAALSIYVAEGKLRSWRGVDRVYEQIGHWLDERGDEEGVVMVNNPPSFWYYTHRMAVVVPNGDVETLLEAADRYGVNYLVLDKHLPFLLWDIYTGKESHPRLQPAAEWEEGSSRVILYEVQR
jgi:4-amino-4-deoxy-L-arabinose transferase-like glycosyltransferase